MTALLHENVAATSEKLIMMVAWHKGGSMAVEDATSYMTIEKSKVNSYWHLKTMFCQLYIFEN